MASDSIVRLRVWTSKLKVFRASDLWVLWCRMSASPFTCSPFMVSSECYLYIIPERDPYNPLLTDSNPYIYLEWTSGSLKCIKAFALLRPSDKGRFWDLWFRVQGLGIAM